MVSSSQYSKHTEKAISIAPSFTIRRPGKTIFLYLLGFIIIAALPTLIFFIGQQSGEPDHFRKPVYLFVYLVIGVSHTFIFPKWFPHLHTRDLKTGPLFSLLMAVFSVLAAFTLLSFTNQQKPSLAIAAGCAFLLPTAIWQLWNYFDFFSSKTYAPWMIPAAMPAQKKATIFLNSLELRLKIKLNYFDISETTFMVTAPGRSTLGRMFHEFLTEGDGIKTNMQLSDEKQMAYAWRFLLQRPLGTIALDPELSLAANKIKQKDIIFAERIKMD